MVKLRPKGDCFGTRPESRGLGSVPGRLISFLVVLVLALAACESDDDTTDTEESMQAAAQITASASMAPPSTATLVALLPVTTIFLTGVDTRIASAQAAVRAALNEPMPRSGFYALPLLSIVSPM